MRVRPRTHRCIGGIDCLWSVAIPDQKACSVHGRRPLVAIKSRISWCCRPSTSRGPGLRDHLPSAESAASNWSCAEEVCVCVVYLSSSRTRTQEPGEGVVNQRTFCLLIVGVVIQRYADCPQWHAAATCGSCKKRSASGDSFWGRTATACFLSRVAFGAKSTTSTQKCTPQDSFLVLLGQRVRRRF